MAVRRPSAAGDHCRAKRGTAMPFSLLLPFSPSPLLLFVYFGPHPDRFSFTVTRSPMRSG
jgi:hypothetical protein